MILKIKLSPVVHLSLSWGYTHAYDHNKQVYWSIYQISGERLQDLWFNSASKFLGCFLVLSKTNSRRTLHSLFVVVSYCQLSFWKLEFLMAPFPNHCLRLPFSNMAHPARFRISCALPEAVVSLQDIVGH